MTNRLLHKFATHHTRKEIMSLLTVAPSTLSRWLRTGSYPPWVDTIITLYTELKSRPARTACAVYDTQSGDFLLVRFNPKRGAPECGHVVARGIPTRSIALSLLQALTP